MNKKFNIKSIEVEAMKKMARKKIASYTINKTLIEQFNSYCQKQKLNKSLVIEKLIQAFLDGKT